MSYVRTSRRMIGDAAAGDVKAGKIFYTTDLMTKLTGTLALTGDAAVGDVKTGKKFYKDDPAVQLTGTLALTGDAAVGDVVTGKKFYKDDPATQLTGTLAIADNAAVGDVRAAKTFHNEPYTQRTGTAGLSEHQNAENTVVGSAAGSVTSYEIWGANGATVGSVTVIVAQRCLITVIAATIVYINSKISEIKRGGVTKTTKTTISAANFALLGAYGHLQYATEVLDAGTYQYDFVNTGVGRAFLGLFMIAVAGTF